MAAPFNSSVLAVKAETTEGTLVNPAAGDFIPARAGFSFQAALETVTSDEFQSDIGASKSFATKEVPTATIPLYVKHSGTESTAPESAILIKSCIGTETDNNTEYTVTSGSSAGSSSARGYLAMASNQEDNFVEGQGLLIKDGTNGYKVRNVYYVDSANNRLDLSFNVANAPASGVALGKAIHYRPTGTGQPTFSAWHYQASSSAQFAQAFAGCRTTNLTFNLAANSLAEMVATVGGIEAFYNPLIVASTNSYIDFVDDGGTKAVQVTSDEYNSPINLAAAVQTAMDAGSVNNITCTYSNSTGKFTITSDGSTFSLLHNTGANIANTILDDLGFSAAADDTGALTYTSDTAFDPSPYGGITPSYDTSDSIVVKNSEILIGLYDAISCKVASTVSVSIDTPKSDVPSICASSGVDSSILASRTVSVSATVLVEQHDVRFFDQLINNTTVGFAVNTGVKDSAGNWTAGTVLNIYSPNMSITGALIANQDSYAVYNITGTCFVNTTNKDIHINFL